MQVQDAVFRVFDTETTGMDKESDKVCEVAVVDVAYANGAWKKLPGERFSRVVNPGTHIPPEASAVHHLTDDDVRGAPDLTQALAALPQVANGVRAAHNAAFDAPMLAENPASWLCTYRLARHLYPEMPRHSNQYLRYALWLEVPEASGLAAHRALADAEVTATLLCHMLHSVEDWLGIDATVEDLLEFCWAPVRVQTFSFGKHTGKQITEVAKADPGYLKWMLRQADDAWDPDLRWSVEQALDPR